jgi:hypothetical protein
MILGLPFSGITPPIRVSPSDGETRTSFSHTFRENPSTSGVTLLLSTIKVYKLHGLSETADNGYAGHKGHHGAMLEEEMEIPLIRYS